MRDVFKRSSLNPILKPSPGRIIKDI